ncbi:putative membrane protein [Nitrobacter vulgaris]|jgi:uncharacterized membrane protein|uniref:DUF1269 domain-containing protein n=1 Tax=Nitrobacter vulgaris TaxID=29421 RepID=A0A1V4HV84_NITVU|nr:DUF1269 domain-containing protein [Nitrobacter vulgaris]MDR6306631.1 putative membrane protein [Nitrobacter vulgaris]OPH81887.1 hypothetical protein B2M20_15590 [Nitrobacter vulgaris]
MAEFLVVGFDKEDDADRVLTELNRLQSEYLIDLEDAVIAIRDPEGKVRIKQSVSLTSYGAATGGLRGAMWGTLIGLLFLNPLAGFALGGAVGAGSGALAGNMIDYGINDDLIKSIGETLKPGTSALFLLIRKAQPEKILARLSDFKGHVIRSSLSSEQEEKLKDALSNAAQPVA